MATKIKFELDVGSEIVVSDSDGKRDEENYTIEALSKSVVELTGSESGKAHRVHISRVIASVVDGNEIPNPAFQETLRKNEKMSGKATATPKKKKTPKKDVEPAKVNFKELQKQGEVWQKENDFDHADFIAKAVCVILADGQSFLTFNTYNGSLGKKGAEGTSYPIKDFKSLTRKRKQLEKKGYELTHKNKDLASYIKENNDN